MLLSPGKSHINWDRLKREEEANAPIAYAPGDGPHDPNDDAAVVAYWEAATVIRRPDSVARREVFGDPLLTTLHSI